MSPSIGTTDKAHPVEDTELSQIAYALALLLPNLESPPGGGGSYSGARPVPGDLLQFYRCFMAVILSRKGGLRALQKTVNSIQDSCGARRPNCIDIAW